MRHCWETMTIPHTRSGHDQDRSRNMRTRNRRLGPLVQHPPPLSLGGITPQQAENQHTTTRKEAASTSLHKTRDLTHPLRGIAPVTWRCTRYVALHPNRRGAMPTDRVQCLHIGCTTPRHKLRCGPARMEVDGPDRLGCARRRRTPPQPTAPDGNEPPQSTGPGSEPPTTNRTRQRHTPNNQQGPGTAELGGALKRRVRGSRCVARAVPNPSAGYTYNKPVRGAHRQRGRGQPRSHAQPTPASSISQTRRSTIRFANASSAVLASPLGSGASAATASSAHVRAS